MLKTNILLILNKEDCTIEISKSDNIYSQKHDVGYMNLDSLNKLLAATIKNFKNPVITICLEGDILTYKIISVSANNKSHLNKLMTYNQREYIITDDYILDYQIIGQDKKLGIYKVALIGAKLNLIEEILSLFNSLDLKLNTIMSQGQLLSRSLKKTQGIAIVIYNNSVFAVYQNNIMYAQEFTNNLSKQNLQYFINAVENLNNEIISQIYVINNADNLGIYNTLEYPIEYICISNFISFIPKPNNIINLLPIKEKENLQNLYQTKLTTQLFVIELLIFVVILVGIPNLHVMYKQQELKTLEYNLNKEELIEASQLQQQMLQNSTNQTLYTNKISYINNSKQIEEDFLQLLGTYDSSNITLKNFSINNQNTRLEGTYIDQNYLMKYIELLETSTTNLDLQINQSTNYFWINAILKGDD